MSTLPKSKKKLDIFNLFYSGAAVVILIGVIAKLLEWPAQDLLITLGLSIEAVVFGVSAIKFVDVKGETMVATEATLAKVADNIDSLKDVVGNDYSNTYVNIQTGTEGNLPLSSTDYKKLSSNNSLADNQGRTNKENVTIKIDAPVSGIGQNSASNAYTNNAVITSAGNNSNHSLSQLENLDILSLSKDLFYQPEWNRFFDEEYTQLTSIFKRVFGKKLPTKEALAFLGQFPVKMPSASIADVVLEQPHTLTSEEIELLYTAFDIIKVNNLFDIFVIEDKDGEYLIRNKKAKEIIVFGGEEEKILNHCKTFYNNVIVITPNVDCLRSLIKVKDSNLLDYLIQKLNLKSEDEFISLTTILQTTSDDFKIKLFNRFKRLTYDFVSESGYVYLKHLALLATNFNDISLGHECFKKLLEIKINNDQTIVLDDVVNYFADTIYFGPKNEYSVVLNEIFINKELENINYVNSIIEKLSNDGIANKAKLLEIFNLKEQDSKNEIFNKLNYHLAKNNIAPTGSQLAFILLQKQYN